MSKSHNKKRNVGVIYELLLRNISECLIRDDKPSAQKALNIIERKFKNGTELYREFRLFNALIRSTVSSSSVAAAILTEAKQAARRCDESLLNREKSLLIREINHNLNDPKFYYRRIPEYKMYATIQTLLNDWRKGDDANFSRVIQYESKVAENLLEQKDVPDINDGANPDVNSLVVNIMTEKINKRYSGKINGEQRDLIRDYVFSISNNKDIKIKSKLTGVKDNILSDLKLFREKTNNKILLEKIDTVNKKLISESFDKVNDESISRFLVLIQLRQELKESLNE
ncbi:MAG: hypothetical protein CMB80_10760 [Flammeovirgaceae bacterium]|nr:hypothetical protein [Flammeovirgaceae bacterium]|tara:strand:- start:299 stop:1153 length:855 start_codon:yes stop_codon:yes gene_type:complete